MKPFICATFNNLRHILPPVSSGICDILMIVKKFRTIAINNPAVRNLIICFQCGFGGPVHGKAPYLSPKTMFQQCGLFLHCLHQIRLPVIFHLIKMQSDSMSHITDFPKICLIPFRKNIKEIAAHQHKISGTDIYVMFNFCHPDGLFYL